MNDVTYFIVYTWESTRENTGEKTRESTTDITRENTRANIRENTKLIERILEQALIRENTCRAYRRSQDAILILVRPPPPPFSQKFSLHDYVIYHGLCCPPGANPNKSHLSNF